MKKVIGVIGGSGLYEMEGLTNIKEVQELILVLIAEFICLKKQKNLQIKKA